MYFALPSFAESGDILFASGHLHATEARELWRLWRGYCHEHAGEALTIGLDGLVAGDVPDTPRLRHWCTVTKALLRAYRGGFDVAPGDVAHFEIDRLAPGRLTQLHSLRLLESWAYDAALKAYGMVEMRLATPELPRRLEIGPAGRLTPADADLHQVWSISLGDRAIVIRVGRDRPIKQVTLDEGVHLSFPSGWHHEAPLGLRHKGSYIYVPAYDSGLCNPHAGATAPIVRDPGAIAEWQPTLARALDYSSAADPALHAECLSYLGEVLPLYHGLGQLFGSASTEEALGYAFLPGISTPLDVAECFVHEAMHQKLFRIEQVIPLFEPNSPAEESYYSPWRQDSRPLRMVLHGCYVFVQVAHLWIEWAKKPPGELVSPAAARKVAFRRSCEVLAGLDLLERYALLTENGKRLLTEIKETATTLAGEARLGSEDRDEVNTRLSAQRQFHLQRGSVCSDPITF